MCIRDSYCASFNAEILLKVYPNPAHELLQIDFVNDYLSGEFQVYDLQGKMVLKHKFYDEINTHQLNIMPLHKGLYLLKVLNESGKEIQQSKFLKL